MIGWKHLPEHVSVYISPKDSPALVEHLNGLGFIPPALQVPKLHVVFSKIIRTTFNGLDAELHLRVFSNGKIEAEYEPPRLAHWLSHIFRRSYSAHEYIISTLEELGIKYAVDELTRQLYNDVFPKEFPFVLSEFYQFIMGGVIVPFVIRPLQKLMRFKPKPPAPLFPLDIFTIATPE